jgi:hypothetical protein
MAKSQKDTEEIGAEFMRQFEDAGLGPLRLMGTAWVEAMAELNGEIASFVADRIKEDVKTQSELLQCKSPKDLQDVQLAFLEKAYAQYTAETGKLIQKSLDLFPGNSAGTKNTPV